MAKYLVENGSNINAVDDNQNTALLKACEISKTIVEFLVEKGATLNVKDDDGNTPMHIAADYGSSSICSFLHEKNVPINAKNNSLVTSYFLMFNETPIHKACYSERLNIVGYLISNGANINISDISLHLNV